MRSNGVSFTCRSSGALAASDVHPSTDMPAQRAFAASLKMRKSEMYLSRMIHELEDGKSHRCKHFIPVGIVTPDQIR